MWYNEFNIQELRWKDAYSFLLTFNRVYKEMAAVQPAFVYPAGNITVFSHNIPLL